MKKLLSLVLIMALSASATVSTLIWQPSVDIQPFLNPHFGLDTYLSLKEPFGTTVNGGLTMGILPFKKIQMEIGVDFRDYNGNHTYPWLLNTKIVSPENSFFKYQPAIVIGTYDIGFTKDVTNYNIIFGQLGETIWKLGRFTIGGFYGNPKLLVNANKLNSDGNPTKDNVGILLGWDRYISELSDKLWLCAEYQGTQSSYGAFSFGFAWNFSSNVSIIYGVDFLNDNKTYAPVATIQIDVNFK